MMKRCAVRIFLLVVLHISITVRAQIPASHAPRPTELADPYFIEVSRETVIHRSFMYYDSVVLPYMISVGTPEGNHYAYNSANGAIIESWTGDFLDASLMWVWKGRGIGIAEPRGTLTKYGNEKTLYAEKPSSETNYNIVDSDNFKFLGYDVDKKNQPVFRYAVGDIIVEDKIRALDQKSLMRSFHFSNLSKKELYCHIVTAPHIVENGRGIFSADNFTIRMPKTMKGNIVRKKDGKEALFVQVKGDFQYDIVQH